MSIGKLYIVDDCGLCSLTIPHVLFYMWKKYMNFTPAFFVYVIKNMSSRNIKNLLSLFLSSDKRTSTADINTVSPFTSHFFFIRESLRQDTTYYNFCPVAQWMFLMKMKI